MPSDVLLKPADDAETGGAISLTVMTEPASASPVPRAMIRHARPARKASGTPGILGERRTNCRQRARPQKARSSAIAEPNWIHDEGSGIGPPVNAPIVGISVPGGRFANPESSINEPGS